MSKTRPDLSALVNAGGGRRQIETPTEQASTIAPKEGQRAKTQKSREGTVPITVMQPEEVRRQLLMIKAETGETIENLVAAALNGLFAKYGKPEIAIVKKKGRAA